MGKTVADQFADGSFRKRTSIDAAIGMIRVAR